MEDGECISGTIIDNIIDYYGIIVLSRARCRNIAGYELISGQRSRGFSVPRLIIFAGQSTGAKIFSREMFSSSLMLGVAGGLTAKVLSVKICF